PGRPPPPTAADPAAAPTRSPRAEWSLPFSSPPRCIVRHHGAIRTDGARRSVTPCQRFGELSTWIHKAESQGKRVLISFSEQVGCNGNCAAPTPSQYAAGVSAFLLQQAPAQVQRTYYYFLAKASGQQESCPGFDTA